jgi:thiamine biosynthesis lipoprotein
MSLNRRSAGAGISIFVGLLCLGAGPLVSAAQSVPAKVALPAPPAPTQLPSHKVHHSVQVMGTVVDLTMWTNDDAGAAGAAKTAFAEFERVDRMMSSWLTESDVAKINSSAGSKAIKVDPEVMKLILRAQEAGKASNGAFDISVGAFRGLWKFDQDVDGSVPNPEDVKKRAKLVNYRKVRAQKKAGKVRLARKGMRITLGGVAKGYAVDQAVAILRKLGHQDFILQAGGDLYASGQPGNRMWKVGIRDPRGDRGTPFAVAQVKNRTFSTSGDYERSIVVKGARYHHILDPATGKPATRTRSVTVLAADALTADIWSTALFVMGSDAGMKIVEARDDMEAVFVDASNKVHVSTGLQGKLHIMKPPTPGI